MEGLTRLISKSFCCLPGWLIIGKSTMLTWELGELINFEWRYIHDLLTYSHIRFLKCSFFRLRTKFETNCFKSDSKATARHITQSNTIVTDITNANVEIILGLRKLGGQILKSDPRSQSEIIERTALRKEETRKLGRTETAECTGIRKESQGVQATTPNYRKMSLG